MYMNSITEAWCLFPQMPKQYMYDYIYKGGDAVKHYTFEPVE